MEAFRKRNPDRNRAIKLAGSIFLVVFGMSFLSAVWFQDTNTRQVKFEVTANIEKPQFTKASGAYSEPFNIEVKKPFDQGVVFYTLDGNTPMPFSEAMMYSGPIHIKALQKSELMYIPSSPRWQRPVGNFPAAVVVNAAKFELGGKVSKNSIATYFVQPAQHPITLPIVSLVTGKKNLFDYENGIYIMGKDYEDKDNYVRKNVRLNIPWWSYPANYQDRGKNAERPVHVDFFNFVGKGFSIEAGLRIHGNATRGFSQKSLRLVFRKKYGSSPLEQEVFSSNEVSAYKSLVLRNSGNDWNKTMMRDAVMHNLLGRITSLETAKCQPVVVMINGEYWGIHQLCERLDEDHLSIKYGMNRDSIELLQLEEANGIAISESSSFKYLLSFATSNNLSSREKYDSISTMMDIDNFIDYIIAEAYTSNTDWPTNNVKSWRYSGEPDKAGVKDGRWRWIIHDLDYGMAYTHNEAYTTDLFEKLNSDRVVGLLLRSLSANEEFRKKMLNRVQFLLSKGLSPTSVNKAFIEMKYTLASEMPRHINRWRAIGSISEWEKNIEVIGTFAKLRPPILLRQFRKFLSVPNEVRGD